MRSARVVVSISIQIHFGRVPIKRGIKMLGSGVQTVRSIEH